MSSKILSASLGLALAGLSLQSSFAGLGDGESLYIDFGKNDVSNGIIMPANAPMNTNAGNSTGVADQYGLYWNNAWVNDAGAGGPVAPPALVNLINSSNGETGINLTLSKGWESNGFNNGGLLSPSESLLGEFASKNATGDYYFINKEFNTSGVASMTFSNLDTTMLYDFKIFATRETTEVRRTLYTIIDINGTHEFLLQTSGAGIGAGGYNGNNDTFAFFEGIVPDESGNITLTVKVDTSNFGYIGALQMTAAVPEPGTVALLGAAGIFGLIIFRRRRAQAL